MLMNTDEVLKELQISMTTLQRLRAAGEFVSPVQISRRRIMWRRDEVAAWVAAR